MTYQQSFAVDGAAGGKSEIAVYDLAGHLVRNVRVGNGTVSLRELRLSNAIYIVKTAGAVDVNNNRVIP